MLLLRARFRDKTHASKLERKFLLLWESFRGPALEREYPFHSERKWRADFAHVGSRTIVEIEGGIYVQGRHTRPAGFIKDAEKHFHAWLLGWSVIRLTAPQITTENVGRIIVRISS